MTLADSYDGYTYSVIQSWEFNNDKTKLVISGNNSEAKTWEILRLTNKEFCFTTTDTYTDFDGQTETDIEEWKLEKVD